MKEKAKEFALDLLYTVAGAAILAVGVSCFVGPAQIAPGGVSGLSILVNFLTDLPVGAVNLAFNIPLILLAWKFLGRRFTLRTLVTVLIQSVLMDVITLWIPVYTGERIMAAEGLELSLDQGLLTVSVTGPDGARDTLRLSLRSGEEGGL